MEDKKKVDTKKIDTKELNSTEKKKSSFSKKKKIKKIVTTGIAYVKSTFNNTIISIADVHGNVVAWSSAGKKGFKGSRKSTPYAAQIAADEVGTKALEYGMKILNICLHVWHK